MVWRCKRNIFLSFYHLLGVYRKFQNVDCVTLENNGMELCCSRNVMTPLSQKLETHIDYVPDFPLVPRLLLDYRKVEFKFWLGQK